MQICRNKIEYLPVNCQHVIQMTSRMMKRGRACAFILIGSVSVPKLMTRPIAVTSRVIYVLLTDRFT